MTIDISVIIPVYNKGHYLHKCISSIQEQTFSNFEIIIVDDGSTDESPQICEKYASLDNRIHVYHKENEGVSSARQLGLEHSKGEYIIHIDPDDWIELNMLEELYQCATSTSADMVICDFFQHINGQIHISKQTPTSTMHLDVLFDLFTKRHSSCCNKLIRLDSIKSNQITFIKGINYCEDMLFNTRLLLNDISISYLPLPLYHYNRDVPTSITNNYSLNDFSKDIALKDTFIYYFRESPVSEICACTMETKILERAFIGHIFNSKEYKIRCCQYQKSIFKYPAWPLYKKILIYLSTIGLYGTCYWLYRVFKP